MEVRSEPVIFPVFVKKKEPLRYWDTRGKTDFEEDTLKTDDKECKHVGKTTTDERKKSPNKQNRNGCNYIFFN